MDIRRVVLEKAKQFPDKPAIIFKDTTITFSQLKDTVFKLTNAFIKAGISKGSKVSIFLPNCPEYIYSYLALFSIGAVVVPLDFMLTEREITGFINHSDSVTLIAKGKKEVDLAALKKSCSQLEKIILMGAEESSASGDFVSWEDLLTQDSQEPNIQVEDADHSAIFYTSGSTGHPKGVLLSYGHLDNPVECIYDFLKVSSDDSYLSAGVPFSHLGGLDYMIFMLAFGSTLVLMDRFHPLEALKNLVKYKVTVFCIVPAMYIAILSMKGIENFDLSALRYAVVFGAPSSPELLKRFLAICPNANLLNGWGMTETAAPNTYSPFDTSKISSIGPFGHGMEAKIVDEQGNAVADSEKGELWVKGKGIMVGYYKEDELTREIITEDGWLKTGDIARKDTDGLFYIVGRKKEMIKVAGEIVFAPEVEAILQRFVKIQEVVVVGIADKLRGEVPKAFIVKKEGEQLTENEVKSYSKENMAHFKIPHHIEFKESLPKTVSGKINKQALIKG